MAIDPITGNTVGQTQAEKAQVSLGDNLNNFLTLLTTQLKNQSPLDPLDSNQVTAQIAQLSQVEQQIATNKNMEKLLAAFLATQYNNAVSYIGKKIEAPGNAGSLHEGEGMFTYYLASKAEKAKITIKDQAGNVVYEGSSDTELGRNIFMWDGKSNAGNAMPNGNYTFEVEAVDANNVPIESQTFTSGIVTSIDSINGEVWASIHDLAVKLGFIKSIQEA